MKYSNSPYKKIPPDLMADYTLSGQIQVKDMTQVRPEWFLKPTEKGSPADWDEYIKKYSLVIGDEEKEKSTPYGHERAFTRVRKAMEFAGIYNKKIAIIGSELPWIESIALHMGCKITTVEYNLPTCTHSDIKFLHWDDFVKEQMIYDACISFSSIEHSGLGRYGDPLSPNEDLNVMSTIKSKMNEESFLVLGVPYSKVDSLVWNGARFYGPLRFPILTAGFRELKRFPEVKRTPCQPVFVLKKHMDPEFANSGIEVLSSDFATPVRK